MYKITIQYAPYRKAIGFVVLKIFSKTSVFIDSKQAIHALHFQLTTSTAILFQMHEYIFKRYLYRI